MLEISPILLAMIAGLIGALIFSLCSVVGPVSLTILNEGTQRGFRWAALIGLGASVMDTVYCGISFSGLSSFFDHGVVKASMQLFTFVFLLVMGSKFLLAKTVKPPSPLNAASEKLEARLEQKFHPHSAFMTGFVRVMGNVGVLAAYILMAAYMMSNKALWTSQDWVQDRFATKAACVGGIFLGTNIWYLGLSFGASRGHGRFSEKTLLRLQQFSGICLILAALFNGLHIIYKLAQHRRTEPSYNYETNSVTLAGNPPNLYFNKQNAW
jgi:threonine/homoserine/homoserine lactone efflux protein